MSAKIIDVAADCDDIETHGECELCEKQGQMFVYYASDPEGERFCRDCYNQVVHADVMSSPGF